MYPPKTELKSRLQPFRRKIETLLTDMNNQVEHLQGNQPAIERKANGADAERGNRAEHNQKGSKAHLVRKSC